MKERTRYQHFSSFLAIAFSHLYFSMPQLRIILVNTKVPRSTKALVARVLEHHDLVGCED